MEKSSSDNRCQHDAYLTNIPVQPSPRLLDDTQSSSKITRPNDTITLDGQVSKW